MRGGARRPGGGRVRGRVRVRVRVRVRGHKGLVASRRSVRVWVERGTNADTQLGHAGCSWSLCLWRP